MDFEIGITNKEVAKLLGLKPALITHYANKGYIKPELADPKGKGTTRRYSRRNLVEILLLRELSKQGLTIEKAVEAVRQAREVVPKQKYKQIIGEEDYQEGYNIWDALNFDDPIIRTSEVFIIVFDAWKDLKIDLKILAGPKDREEVKAEIKRFMFFPVNLLDHNSALIVNVTQLFQEVMQNG